MKGADAETDRALWDELAPGDVVTVVKRDHGDLETARYQGTVVRSPLPSPWITVRAPWVLPDTDQGGLVLATGDTLDEHFSPEHPFNAFAVISPEGELKGWYANVTEPARLERVGDELVLTWIDLILDLVRFTDGTISTLDGDEFEVAMKDDPFRRAMIFAAGTELKEAALAGEVPFVWRPRRKLLGSQSRLRRLRRAE